MIKSLRVWAPHPSLSRRHLEGRVCVPSSRKSGVRVNAVQRDLGLLPGLLWGEAPLVCSLRGWLWFGFGSSSLELLLSLVFFRERNSLCLVFLGPLYIHVLMFYKLLLHPENGSWGVRSLGLERIRTKNSAIWSCQTYTPSPHQSTKSVDLYFLPFLPEFPLTSLLRLQVHDSTPGFNAEGKNPIM